MKSAELGLAEGEAVQLLMQPGVESHFVWHHSMSAKHNTMPDMKSQLTSYTLACLYHGCRLVFRCGVCIDIIS